ncbi:MAG: hypothetical protein JJE25_05580, partial [Bacteroidia bacterium]|nr:hypothetical protein [Bacteroidia bacterium]
NKLPEPYSEFEGKIIREIHITTLDPFGYSVTDTATQTQNILSNAGNGTHVKSQRITIRNLLLIHKNDPFDSLLVKESERLIRSQSYVHEVSFHVVYVGAKSDSVDIYIRELDTWSINPEVSASTESYTVDVTDKNFLGFGHRFQNVFSRDYIAGTNSFYTNYSIPNIRNTFISSTLHYGIDGQGNYNRSLNIDRPFFSPFAKWAAGVFIIQQFQYNSIHVNDSVSVQQDIKYTVEDYWAGNSRQVFKGNTEDARTTNLILAARYLRVRYQERPIELYDPLHNYSNEDFPMAAVGISTRKYVQDKFIFKYGPTEDVPVGQVYGITGGYQVRNNIGRIYAGARFSFGNYTQWGYMSYNFEYGTFFRSSHAEQGVFTAGVNYFTDLFEIGNWKFRQFIKPQLTLGINRFSYENITINNENGLRGFSTSSLAGTKKVVVTLQTQSYAPWNVLGFRFGPYLIYSLGILGNDGTGFRNNHMYSQFGFGVLIKNEYLVFNYFQISVAFYPVIPGDGENIFKINSNTTTDIGFRDFIIGKPGTAAYQ